MHFATAKINYWYVIDFYDIPKIFEFQYNYVAISTESIVTEFYDGEGNGIWDPAELRTNNSNDCDTYLQDSDGGFCDTGNKKWDDEEIYADENQNVLI